MKKSWLIANIEKVAVWIACPLALLAFALFDKREIPAEAKHQLGNAVMWVAGAGFIIATIIGFRCACYVRKNYADVVSRRTRWKTSSADLWGDKWKYIINRFIVVIIGVMMIIGACTAMVAGFWVLMTS